MHKLDLGEVVGLGVIMIAVCYFGAHLISQFIVCH